jgi:hypothetical protein
VWMGVDVIAMAGGWMLLVGLFALARVWFGR